MEKSNLEKKKLIRLETAILISFIALAAGFLGGIVFSAFRMGDTLPATSKNMVFDETASGQTPTAEQLKEIANLEEAATQTPDNGDAWVALGNASFDYNLPEKAIHAYETALKFQPNNAGVWTDLGVMYRRNGNPEKAVAAFDKAQSIEPGHEVSLFNKGIVLMHDLSDMPGAVAAWNKLLEINPAATTPGGMSIKDLVEKMKNQP